MADEFALPSNVEVTDAHKLAVPSALQGRGTQHFPPTHDDLAHGVQTESRETFSRADEPQSTIDLIPESEVDINYEQQEH